MDVNVDGWLIFTRYPLLEGNTDSGRNELWINQTKLHIQDQAKEFGIRRASIALRFIFWFWSKMEIGSFSTKQITHQVITEIRVWQARQMRHPQVGPTIHAKWCAGKYIGHPTKRLASKGHSLGFGLGVVLRILIKIALCDRSQLLSSISR